MQLLKQNVAFEDCMLHLPNEPQYATILNRTLRFRVACCSCLYEPQYATVKQNIAF